MSYHGYRRHDLSDALKELDIELRWRRAERQSRLRDLEDQWFATSCERGDVLNLSQDSRNSETTGHRSSWDQGRFQDSQLDMFSDRSSCPERKRYEIDSEKQSMLSDSDLEKIRELVAARTRNGDARARSGRNLASFRPSDLSSSSRSSSPSDKSSAVDVGALLNDLRRSTPRWKSLESPKGRERLPAVALLRAGDPEAVVQEWPKPFSTSSRGGTIHIYVEDARASRSNRPAPCYEVAATVATSVGAVLETVAPHARAAWRYTLGDGSEEDVPVVSEMWLCVRCRPGGALMPLRRRDRVHAALAEWKDVAASGWPRLFVARADTCA